ncbi:hypothetical protein [Spirosoma sp. KNUC1025]|uniref:hypothetical protein n=1 Tax=Spirosoma sp. KNUC1025 TaxID=2894082 RepID=UPI00386505D6|nr:hypothetical protein LN737_00860 [Spirosoma sp. KNUC1025]
MYQVSTKRTTTTVYGMKGLLSFFCLLVLYSCGSKKQSTPGKPADPVATNVDSNPAPVFEKMSEKAMATDKAVEGAGTWHYSKTVDKEGRTVYKASLVSPTLLEFEFPYAGGSVATLTVRKRESDTHVYIQVSKGQFNRSYQDGRARVRFDGNPPTDYSFSAAENGSANVIFFDSEQALLNQMKAARKMVVDIEFAGQGKRQIEFRTAGLTWNH